MRCTQLFRPKESGNGMYCSKCVREISLVDSLTSPHNKEYCLHCGMERGYGRKPVSVKNESPKPSRLSWEEHSLGLAKVAALRSEDQFEKVGACVLRHDNSVGGVGFNGAPSGITIDGSDRDKRRPFYIHAEVNALAYTKPGECRLLACTLSPCSSCMAMIARYGIKKVVYEKEYDKDTTSKEVAEKFGIELVKIKLPFGIALL